MPIISASFAKTLSAYNGSIVFGPRSGSKVETLSISPDLPTSDPLQDRLPITVQRVESLRSGLSDAITYKDQVYNVTDWSEWLVCSRNSTTNSSGPSEVLYKNYREGSSASCLHQTEDGKISRYLGFNPTLDFLIPFFADVLQQAGVHNVLGQDVGQDVGQNIRLVRNSLALYVFNFSSQNQSVPQLPQGAELVVGGGVDGDENVISPSGVHVYKLK